MFFSSILFFLPSFSRFLPVQAIVPATRTLGSCTGVVPKSWAVYQYRSMGHLVPVHTKRINNLPNFVLFIIWNCTLFYYEKLPDSPHNIHLWHTIDACLLLHFTSCSCLVYIRHTWKASRWKFCPSLNQSVVCPLNCSLSRQILMHL